MPPFPMSILNIHTWQNFQNKQNLIALGCQHPICFQLSNVIGFTTFNASQQICQITSILFAILEKAQLIHIIFLADDNSLEGRANKAKSSNDPVDDEEDWERKDSMPIHSAKFDEEDWESGSHLRCIPCFMCKYSTGIIVTALRWSRAQVFMPQACKLIQRIIKLLFIITRDCFWTGVNAVLYLLGGL